MANICDVTETVDKVHCTFTRCSKCKYSRYRLFFSQRERLFFPLQETVGAVAVNNDLKLYGEDDAITAKWDS